MWRKNTHLSFYYLFHENNLRIIDIFNTDYDFNYLPIIAYCHKYQNNEQIIEKYYSQLKS